MMASLHGWPLFFQRLFTTPGFMLLRFIFMMIQKVYWQSNGTTHRIRQSRRPESYKQCAHVLDIVLQYQFDNSYPCSIKNYILSHNRFENPQYILDNDHVSLITVNEENAIFGVAKQKGMQLWKYEYCSFMRVAQVLHCTQLILVPLDSFHRMAEELGDPKGELIFLFNTGRCGATLVSQMMQTTGKCLSISEPDSISTIALLYRNNGDSAQLRQLCRDVVRWTCRPYKDFSPLAYMFKVMPFYTYALPFFREVYPHSKFLFMYRDVTKVAQSFCRISRELPALVLTNMLGKWSSLLSEKCFNNIGYIGKDFRYKFWDDFSMGFLMATAGCKSYVEFRRTGLEVSALRYEDIMKDKHFAARAILEFCGLPLSLERDFLHGLEFDSQSNSGFSQKQLAIHKAPALAAESERLSNVILKKSHLPNIGDDWLLEGTITYKGSKAEDFPHHK